MPDRPFDHSLESGSQFPAHLRPRGRRLGRWQVLQELRRLPGWVLYQAEPLTGEGQGQTALLIRESPLPPPLLDDFLDRAPLRPQLLHANLAQVLEVGHDQGRPYYALEHAAGVAFSDTLRGGSLEPAQVRRLGIQLAEGLAYCHEQGVVHGRLEPGSIGIGANQRPWILDIGPRRDRDLLEPGALPPDPSDDVHGLGRLLAAALSPRASGADPDRPRIPQALSELCQRCLDRDPARRPESLAALAAELRDLEDGVETRWRPPALSRRSSGWTWVMLPLITAATGLSGWIATTRWRRSLAEDRLAAGRAALQQLELEQARWALRSARQLGRDRRQLLAAADVAWAELELAEALIRCQQRLESGDVGGASRLLRGLERIDSPDLSPALAQRAAQIRRQIALRRLQRLGAGDPPGLLRAAVREADQADQAAPSPQPDVAAARRRLSLGLQESAERQARSRQTPLVQLDRALRLAEEVASPGDVSSEQARLARASLHWRRGRYGEAADLARSLEQASREVAAQASYVLAFCALWQERYQDGLNQLRALHEREPGPVGLNAGAVYNSYSGRNARGEELARAALEARPDYADAWISLAFCLNDLKRWEESLEASQRALELAPDHPRAHQARAFALGNLERGSETYAAYSEVVELTRPRPPTRTLRNRALLGLQLNNVAGAAQDAELLLELSGRRDPLAWLILGSVQRRVGNPEWTQAVQQAYRLAGQNLGRLASQLPREDLEAIQRLAR